MCHLTDQFMFHFPAIPDIETPITNWKSFGGEKKRGVVRSPCSKEKTCHLQVFFMVQSLAKASRVYIHTILQHCWWNHLEPDHHEGERRDHPHGLYCWLLVSVRSKWSVPLMDVLWTRLFRIYAFESKLQLPHAACPADLLALLEMGLWTP
jgi:hypothetical protein